MGLERNLPLPSSKNPPTLLTLPPELRGRIFALASPPPPAMAVFHPFILVSHDHSQFSHPLHLVSKQVYRETFHMPFQRRLYFLNTDVLGHFLARVGHVRRQQVVHMMFLWREHQSKWAFRLPKMCRNLRSVTILVEGRQHLPGYAALREVRGLEEVRVVCIREEKEASSGEFWEKPVEERAEFDGVGLGRLV